VWIISTLSGAFDNGLKKKFSLFSWFSPEASFDCAFQRPAVPPLRTGSNKIRAIAWMKAPRKLLLQVLR